MNSTWTTSADDAFLLEHPNAFKYGVIKLVSWPDLAQVPESQQPIVARICALLSRKLSAGRLVPLILSASETEVFRALATLTRMGHVALASGEPAVPIAGQDQVSEPMPLESELPGATRPRRSLIGKLWAKLTG